MIDTGTSASLFLSPYNVCAIAVLTRCKKPVMFLLDWTVQCFTSLPTQYRLYGRLVYRSKDPTNSIKVLKEATKENKNNTKNINTKKYKIVHAKEIRIYNTASPLVYSNMGLTRGRLP